MKLSEILSVIEYDNIIKNDIEICDIVYDSRKATDGVIFVCLSGLKLDGHAFAQSAYQNGARVFICEKEVDLPDDSQIFIVKNSRVVLGEIAAKFFSYPAKELKVIGITGTKGKTTVAHLVQGILNENGIPCGIIGTVGAEFGGKKYPTSNTTPESYELHKLFRAMLNEGCRAVALEVSSLGVKHGRIDGIPFACGIFTNLSPDHIGPLEHDSFEEYAYWKSVFFERCETAVMNFDDAAYTIMKEKCKCKIISYGLDESYDISAKNVRPLRTRNEMGINFDCSAFNKNLKIISPLPGNFNVYNIMSAIGAVISIGCSIDNAVDALRKVRVKGRAEILDIDADYDVIIDYAHNGLSLKSIIETLYAYKTGRIICVFGSVGGRTQERRREMGLVAGSMCDLCVLTSDNPDFEEPMSVINDIAKAVEEVNGNYICEPDRKKAIEKALSISKNNDIILLAGKGHEEYQLIEGVKVPFSEKECVSDYIRRLSTNA
ncbi:MAG: UDP-N-acetylmuramoyl-L-alanyl-D-glutamate--2,6-diaminopimelate ligase [Clostridia bacterium]|nr:UDP-N-acetylmuramoyl-L-alanyl-D-glutamate--2,6-diaminopimelate ligase [Clostridia bacterium]